MATNKNPTSLTLGELLKRERSRRGLTITQLSQAAGIAVGQVHKLENDKVKKVNPAHFAVVAEPLGVPLSKLYAAAGYATTEEVAGLEPQLVRRLAELPPDALRKLDRFLEGLLPATVPVEVIDDSDANETEGESDGK